MGGLLKSRVSNDTRIVFTAQLHIVVHMYILSVHNYLSYTTFQSNPTAPLLLAWWKCLYANHLWSVTTEPEAVGVPKVTDTGTKALHLYNYISTVQGTNLADNNLKLDGVECTGNHPCSRCVTGIISITVALAVEYK